MITRKSQQQKILDVLQSLRGEHDIPEEYIRRHETGDGISSRYFKGDADKRSKTAKFRN
jgi:hypothetical protein